MDKPGTVQRFHMMKPSTPAPKNPAKTKRTGPVIRADALGEVSDLVAAGLLGRRLWPDLAVE
jgi:hypothetical protein